MMRKIIDWSQVQFRYNLLRSGLGAPTLMRTKAYL